MSRQRPLLALSLALSALWGATAHAGDLVVSAAASLTNAFKEVARGYEKENPGTQVILNFGASDVLLQQIVKGAPADVFASADQKAMDKAVAEKAVKPASRVDFAANQIVLIVPTDSKANITALKDLTRDDVKRIAYGNPASVPVGRYTQGALEAAGLWNVVQAKSVLAQNVRQSLDYVSRGEVDAGFVFATDAAVMPDKVKVALRVPSQTPVTYPIAMTTREAAAQDAARFVAYVLSPAGQAILSRYGFQKP
ncbi:molybdate ABC transporter substrate-binding protein [Achromobacter sp. MYb9]|uniref:molybdate ABC transporter substrate-binding protein n=1 Tax=Achromobacter sp. MYb9 TaxID=1827284 RepID=UPI000CFB2293|nr:molybdate ABC transporter substrate-binding protein [Achromobacter sp. MYb9]PQZ70101.1 molybdate ABC transporter substrate-binding protein [Achromobacter sp. MYb9]